MDGATSAAVLAKFLRHAGNEPLIHIPDRLFEGYGPNTEAVRALAEKGARLLVTVDCGTTSIEPLAEAKELGLDVVVIDHHQADEALPPADALVNPNRLDDLSGLNHLAAVRPRVHDRGRGQSRTAQARLLARAAARAGPARLCSISWRSARSPTWCRSRGSTAPSSSKGLIAMRRREHVGLTALMDAARLTGPPECWHLGFLLGPRINAGGRIGRADLGVRLLLEEDADARPARMAAELDRLNRERQVIEQADAGAGRSRGDGGARHRGEGRRGGDAPGRAGIRAWSGWSRRG